MPVTYEQDSSVFAAIDTAFTARSTGTDPVGLNCTGYSPLGLPAAFLTLQELRGWLLEHPGPDHYAARNAVWHDLIVAARHDPAWMTAALGMALPALVRAAGHLARGHHEQRDDIDAEMVTALMTAARRLDLDAEGLYEKLRWHALRAGMDVRAQDEPYQLVPDVEQIAGAAPRLPYGHPDLIVARAVAADIIDASDAELIMLTRLDRTPLHVVATQQGLDAATARMRRLRAERALVDAVRGGLLSGAVSADSHRTVRRRAVTRGAVRAAFASAA